MLAYSAKPFDSSLHLFEVKWDGTRCILFLQGDRIRLQNRRLEEITFRYPELQELHRAVRAKDVILDGELVILSRGRPSFRRLQQREQIRDSLKIKLLSRELPATYIVFDLLFLDGRRQTELPLLERKRILHDVLRESPFLLECGYAMEWGRAYFQGASNRGLEGVMAKQVDSPYLIGERSWYWLKVKSWSTAICHIIGYMEGKGSREGRFGSLVVAEEGEGKWIYRGRVGSGLTEEEREALSARLERLKVNSPPFSPVPPEAKNAHWVKPRLRCEVRYQEITERGHFRTSVFKRLLH